MARSFHLLILTTCICLSGYAQTVVLQASRDNTNTDSIFRFERTILGEFIYLNVDVLDNIYLITSGNRLKKLNSKGDSVAVFNDVKKYGNPTLIDVNNPLKILVYYKNYSTVVVLDRFLTQRNSINFRKQGIFSVNAISTSYDNNIWLFDEQDNKLKKTDETGKILLESPDMRQQLDTIPSPQYIMDSRNLVFLYDVLKGFYIYDYYGAFKTRLPFTNWSDIAISGNKLFGFSNNMLYSYELQSLNLKSYVLPSFVQNYISIKAVNGKLYLLKKNALEIYRFE